MLLHAKCVYSSKHARAKQQLTILHVRRAVVLVSLCSAIVSVSDRVERQALLQEIISRTLANARVESAP